MQSDTLDIIWNARFIISVKTFPVDLQLSAHAILITNTTYITLVILVILCKWIDPLLNGIGRIACVVEITNNWIT